MVDAIQAIILGIIQGLTEWLPISSSGHLALVQLVMNLQVPIFFDIVLHQGTLIAIIGVYRNELISIFHSIISIPLKTKGSKDKLNTTKERWDGKYLQLIILAMIPTALMGLGFRSQFEESFYSVWMIGLGFMISGFMILATKFVRKGTNSVTRVDAVMIGLGQGLSIFSSISRSGATISIGMFRGIEGSQLVTFSFLLSIPTIIGAGLYDLAHVDPSSLAEIARVPIESYIIGTLSAALVGYISIKFLIKIVNRGDFYLFSFYCLLIGSLIFAGLI
jgi:undecaprenyl-diphosphatase